MEGRSLLSCKWALQIVLNLVDGERRPSQLLRSIKGVRERILYDRLSRLLKGGLLGKWSKEGYPKETYYYLKDPDEFRLIKEWISELDLSVDDIVRIFSCKWTMRVMENLREPKTPSQLKSDLNGISDKILQDRLSKLQELGLVRREVFPSKPVRVLYSLSDEGVKLLPTLLNMESFILRR